MVIPNPIRKKQPTPAEMVDRVRKLTRKKSPAWRNYLRRLAEHSQYISKKRKPKTVSPWVEERSYSFHFKAQFGTPLGKFFGQRGPKQLDEIIIAKGLKQPVILDDGPGRGIAMKQLREKLTKRGIIPHIIGVYAEKRNSKLEAQQQAGVFDELHQGLAEHFVPKRKCDVIISFFGSVFHTPSFLKKEHIAKYAYSLNKGGLFVAAIHAGEEAQSTESQQNNLITQLNTLKRSLTPHGFRMEIYPTPTHEKDAFRQIARKRWKDPAGLGSLADFTIIIQRIK